MVPQIPQNTKRCTKCSLELSSSEFYFDKVRQQPQSHCKLCSKKYYQSHRAEILSQRKKTYQQNPQLKNDYNRAYRLSNPLVRTRVVQKHYIKLKKDSGRYTLHRKRKNATEAKRRALKLKATTVWSHLADIKEFYLQCPVGHHVDHIYPLCGKIVSGLHVLANLQYLPDLENLAKGNKMPEDYERFKELKQRRKVNSDRSRKRKET